MFLANVSAAHITDIMRNVTWLSLIFSIFFDISRELLLALLICVISILCIRQTDDQFSVSLPHISLRLSQNTPKILKITDYRISRGREFFERIPKAVESMQTLSFVELRRVYDDRMEKCAFLGLTAPNKAVWMLPFGGGLRAAMGSIPTPTLFPLKLGNNGTV